MSDESVRAQARVSSSVMGLSIVIPVHNEVSVVGTMLDELMVTLDRRPDRLVEVIVVDDGSTDGTAAILAGYRDPRVTVLAGSDRRGSGHARRRGTSLAQGHQVLWIDGDGAFPPDEALLLVDGLHGYDQVVGQRRTESGAWPWVRRPVKRVICLAVSCLWRRHIPDLNCGVRAFQRTAVMSFLEELPDGFSCVSTATLAALNRGHRLRFMPISYRTRQPGSRSKFRPVRDTWRLLMAVRRQWRARQAAAAVRWPER